jgi:hypothetical protein
MVNNSLIQCVAFPLVIAGLFHFRVAGRVPCICTSAQRPIGPVACNAEVATACAAANRRALSASWPVRVRDCLRSFGFELQGPCAAFPTSSATDHKSSRRSGKRSLRAPRGHCLKQAGSAESGERDFVVLDASDVLNDAFAVSSPCIDAEGEVSSCCGHRDSPRLQSSSASLSNETSNFRLPALEAV